MKKTIKALRKPIAILILIISFVACDKDFYEIDSAVLGKDNANFSVPDTILNIVSYNKNLENIQVNNLPANLLGYFNDPEFGPTTASIVTQISSASIGTDFGINPVLDSVILQIPYFSRVTGTDPNTGETEYTVSDSLFGDSKSKIKLSIYENKYFLIDFNPFTLEPQTYYSHPNNGASGNFVRTNNSIVNIDDFAGTLLANIEDSIPSSKPTETWLNVNGEIEKTFSAPSLRVKLDSLFWQNTILNKNGEQELSNSNEFANYFRGLYFKAEAITDKGSMAMLNLASSDANIILYYKAGDANNRVQNTITFNFNGNRLNTFVNNYNAPSANSNSTLGDDKLYIKGMEGSMAVVDLFPTTEDLEKFINDFRIPEGDGFLEDDTTGDFILEKLINEAYIEVYEDESIDATYHEYDRIYAYDIKNNVPTIDYLIDPTENAAQPVFSKVIHLGQRLKDNEGAYRYKIRLTEHLNNILQKDSTNTKIGLVLSSNVNIVSNSEILNSTDDITQVPSVSVITPRGTVLHGSNSSVTEKRMVLKLFVTKPDKL